MMPVRLTSIWLAMALMLSACYGNESSTNNAEAGIFAEGLWFPREQLSALKSGKLSGNFMWNFSRFSFETSDTSEGSPHLQAEYLVLIADLTSCEPGWCRDGETILVFIVDGNDTLARFSSDGLDGDHLYQRVSPPDLSINDYPDWLWRKLYFTRTYQCRYPRIDTNFTLSLDENGAVTGSDTWTRYEFHYEHDYPTLVFYNGQGQRFAYMFTTYSEYSERQNGFNLHEVLNNGTLFDAADGEVEIGEFIFEFDGVVD